MSEKILEKILTLNVNTNVDIQTIIERYVLYTSIVEVIVALIIASVVIYIAIMIFRCAGKAQNIAEKSEALKKMEKVMESFDNWKRMDNLQGDINEIIAYMPRNKKPRSKR